MIATSIEQSKKLLELGVNPETADTYWQHIQDKETNKDFWKIEIIQLVWRPFKGIKDNYIPAWSLSALLGLIPKAVSRGASAFTFSLFPTWERTWVAIYETADNYVLKMKEASTPLEAVYEMLVYLLENNYIKTEIKS